MAQGGLRETEVRYVSADGVAVTTNLDEVDAQRAVGGLPVRKVRSYAGQRHYAGLFWSATTGQHVRYESRLELSRLLLADFDPQISGIASQPMWFSGIDGSQRRRHAPDLLLRYRDGSFAVVDVKPAKFCDRPEVEAVFDWTRRLCAARGWRFEVWSGGPETLLANVRWLSAARRGGLIEPAALEAVTHAGRSGMSIGQICEAVRPAISSELSRPAVMSLLWSGQWLTDLDRPLSDRSLIAWAEGAV